MIVYKRIIRRARVLLSAHAYLQHTYTYCWAIPARVSQSRLCNVFQWPCFDNSKPKNGFASCLNGKSVNVSTPTHHPILFNVSPLSRKNSGVGAGELCTELECSLSSGGQPEENYVAFETRTFYLVTLLKFRF